MCELKPHFEIFIKVNWLLKGDLSCWPAFLFKEIVKKAQKICHIQGGFKINDKFAFSQSASKGNLILFAAFLKKITEIDLLQQTGYRNALNGFLINFNLIFPFTLLKHQELTDIGKAYTEGLNISLA